MTVRIVPAAAALLLLLTACARGEDAHPLDNMATGDGNAAIAVEDEIAVNTANASDEARPTDAWIGKWIGVEGLVLDIQPAGEPGRYMLSVTLLDGMRTYEGIADGERISFTRDGEAQFIRAATGKETGLKWLADKQDCLMIQQGEGFCRGAPKAAPTTPRP